MGSDDQEAQLQFIRDQDIIRDRKQQRDQLDLALQAKNKDLENVVCKLGKSTETLWLLTNEQKAFRDNLRKSGLRYNGPYVLSQAYAKIPKLYHAYELCDQNEKLDAEQSRLKMNKFQKDEKVQALKIKLIDYEKLNKLYDNFVSQKELSAEQTYFSSSFTSSEEISSWTKPSISSMPSANPMLVDLNKMENVFRKLFELLEKRDVKEMKDVFVSVENDLDETLKQNKLLKDRLLEASLAEGIKNLVITSYVEIRNKDLHDETERISKESKDVSNESKTFDAVCNDAFEVTQELSKRIVELEKGLSKFEAKNIAFEIAIQHKSRENNSLITLQKENENFMASLQIENAHLKKTYKDLFESVQRSRVKTNHCDEVKVKVIFDEIEVNNIELGHRVASLIKENEHLKLTYQSLFDSIKKSRVQTKTSNVTQHEVENLKS
uniref:Reverse transcriptase zinc-binding domain-containing protein n=1 Tax=Tanacetum cinerariifolium TaxID=118510 RepID=A0A6L2MW66_TANCI|nr:reverse transcriptase zinc-binding domain-containing protein [Tanacetum cinerariifolium]GEV40867.1 reverse transcriptase zinc-binding domain-containing protein [Tanacetum cinerariifolium]